MANAAESTACLHNLLSISMRAVTQGTKIRRFRRGREREAGRRRSTKEPTQRGRHDKRTVSAEVQG